MFTVYRTLLSLGHLLYGLFLYLQHWWLTIHRKWCELWYGENSRTETEILVRFANEMKKLPRHLVIILGEKNESLLDCVRIIAWCVTIGIPYISFYERNGFFIDNETVIKKEFVKQRPELVERVSWSVSTTLIRQNGYKNKTHILLLSHTHGKGEIVSLTKTLAKATTAGSFKSEEINEELLSEKLSLRGTPDPDLVLICGHVCSTYSLLPWHTRTTEFFTLPFYVNISINEFANVLRRYNKCVQRYGK